ncbi:MAG TPA: ABC transporter ATP-binding protein [Firmicutes bacterium]|nr:ABC transporter ATP-binding protein [Bacillota bacterium]
MTVETERRPTASILRSLIREVCKLADPAIEVHGLSKRYGDHAALDQVDFSVRRGEIFGLLGPNGAGKTTTLECLEGLRLPDAGRLRVMGIDPTRERHKLRQVMGVQLQTGSLPAYFTIREMIRLFSAYHEVNPDWAVTERLGLGNLLNTQYQALSTGQKRRLSLALATLHQPAVLLLDEPTAGLDVGARIALHELMRELRAQGTTILLSTHDMAEAETMADRVAILLQGRIVAVGTPRELTATGAGLTKVTVRTINNSLRAFTHPQIRQSQQQDEYAVFYTTEPGPVVTAIMHHIQTEADELVDLRVERPSLEERFLELTRTAASDV